MNRLKFSILLLGLVAILHPSISAEAEAPAQVAGASEEIISFQTLGYDDITMVSPFASSEVRFSLPEYWSLQYGSELVLDMSVFLSGLDAGAGAGVPIYGGILTVEFNDSLIETIRIDNSLPEQVRIPLLLTSLTSRRDDGRHILSLSLVSEASCTEDIDVLLIIKNSSYFVLPYEEASLPLDLSYLPRPFFSDDAYLQTPVIMVVPDAPSQAEANSMVIASAGLGSATGKEFSFDVLPVSALTEIQRVESNLIFVGLPDAFPSASSLALPAPLTNSKFELSWADPDDGFLQIVTSPWNPNRVVLFVSGNSEAALLKAAHAFSTNSIMLMNKAKNLALVKDVTLSGEIVDSPVDFTFENLGYDTFTPTKIGESVLSYNFNATQAQTRSTEAFVDIHYSYSSVLENNLSSILVTINDLPIATLEMNSEVLGDVTARISIPRNVLRVGRNELQVRPVLIPIQDCSALLFSNIWTTIFNDSAMHLPLGEDIVELREPVLNLRLYPDMFLEDISLDDVSFVVPTDSPSAWNAASQIAFYLGHKAQSLITSPGLSFGDEADATMSNSKYLIIVGRASLIPVLGELDSYLPAPFEAGSDVATENFFSVSYRSEPGADIGYVQLSHSPWAEGQIVLGVFGETDAGMLWAVDTLTNDSRVNDLNGDFALVTDTQIQTASTFLVPEGASLVTDLDEETVEPAADIVAVPLLEPVMTETFSWVFPLLIASGVGLLLLLLLLLYLSIFRRRKEQSEWNSFKASFNEPGENENDLES